MSESSTKRPPLKGAICNPLLQIILLIVELLVNLIKVCGTDSVAKKLSLKIELLPIFNILFLLN